MPIPPAFLPVLKLLHQRLSDLPHPWAFTGSVGMVLQGMNLTPHDIDLQSDEAGAYDLERRLAEYVTRPVYLRETERFRSHFGELAINGVEVEIMGDMLKRLEDGQWTPSTDLANVTRWAALDGLTFPVLDLAYEEESYRQMGRLAKANLIHHFRVGQGEHRHQDG